MPLLLEYWKPIVGWDELYEISILGTVRRLKTSQGARAGVTLRPYVNGKGYWALNLWKDAKQHKYTVHALVAMTFIGPYPDGQEVNHKDSDRNNPRLSNLEYTTPRGNIIHGRDRLQREAGVRSHTCILTAEEALAIYSLREHLSCDEIGERFGVSRQVASGIVFGRSWSWVTGSAGGSRPPRKGKAARDRLREQILAADLTLSSRIVGRLLGVSHSYVQFVRKNGRDAAW
ncbi:MAG: NUMOD4 motif-containing HNH endonuclease [Planctomycetes bacterium]|nr:NUMOD4 motif-containing HNH endonuclease [Planctomycetota bacterium]